MVKAVIFDCFGVVLSDDLDQAYRTAGGDPVKDHQFIRETLYQANSGRIPSSQPVFAEHLGISVKEWFQAMKVLREIDMELLAYVQRLRKAYKVGMLSNISKTGLANYFEPGFLEQYFDEVVASGVIGFAKPEARAYEITADRLGVRLDECVFTDDREEYIEGARAVGMQTILYTDFADFKNKLEKTLGAIHEDI